MPVTVVAFLVTFGKYFSVNWFGFFMTSTVGLEVLLFATTGGNKFVQTEKVNAPKVAEPNQELIEARRQRRAAEEQQAQQHQDETKKSAAQTKQEKKAAAAAAKKTKQAQ